jgi:hypothetical protein
VLPGAEDADVGGVRVAEVVTRESPAAPVLVVSGVGHDAVVGAAGACAAGAGAVAAEHRG